MKEGKGIILERGVAWIKLHRVPLSLGDKIVELLRKEFGPYIFPADERLEPTTETFVQPVPDHCDRIIWRGRYFHLPIGLDPLDQALNSGNGTYKP